MTTFHQTLSFETRGNCDIIEISNRIQDIVNRSGISTGICTVFASGSTGSITTIEYEKGLLKDLPESLERIAPKDAKYEHDKMWGDGNGHSHVRAAIIGPSLTVPIVKRNLTLGTWQQIVFIDFDNRPRSRNLEIVLIGE